MDQGRTDTRIAIIGRAGRFPSASNVAEFWRLLSEGRSAGRRLSAAELRAAGVSPRLIADPAYVPVANILPDMECFDAGFFGFSPREASILDPQHRHFLECGWEALEDAGHMPERFDGRIGVFAGSGMQAYLPYNLLSNPDLVEEIGLFLLRHTGNDKDFLTTRLSYLLNLTGPSMAVQTACSTSLVAVHLAMSSLLAMECDMAIAGGVTIELPHRQGYRYAEGEILSPDGLCRAFDDDSKGTVFGSGAALVVLRRYEDAVADGDDIKAVILSSAVNNDGAGKASYLAPSVDGQAEAAAEALALSGLTPSDVSYIETHGTGTPIGDPIELSALNQVYGEAAPGSIGVGSVKTNIGHLDTAAGTASLIKVVEALRHRRLPASLNFRKPNSRFDFAASPFRVVAEGRTWDSGRPRRAAVNSLGVGGTNAHLILEEAPVRPAGVSTGDWRVFPFSARSPAAADRFRAKFAAEIDEGADPADIAFTLREGRREFAERFAVAARDVAELKAALIARAPALRWSGRAGTTPPRIVFLYPGGGAQYPGAGAGLLVQSPVFAAAVADCFAGLPAEAPADLRATMFDCDLSDAGARLRMARSAYAIPALFILEYAYTRLWESWGIRPDAILAHSVGEYAGAVTAGTLRLEDALRIVTLRGKVMDEAPAGAMTTVPADAEAVRALIGAELDIAAMNGTQATVVSGSRADIEALETRLAGTPQEARRIQIDVAAHSRLLDCQLDRFRSGIADIGFGRPAIPMVSSLRGNWARDDDLASADYWVRHLRHTVRFTQAAACALDRPDTVVIEVGPGQTTGPLVAAAEVAHPARAVLSSAPRPRDGDDEMGVAVAALGGLWAQGVALDPARLPGGAQGRRLSLPTYAFEKERHWIEPGQGTGRANTAPELPAIARKPDPADWFESLAWAEAATAPATPDLRGDWLVFAGDDALSAEVLGRIRAAGGQADVVRPGESFAAADDGFRLRPDQPDDYRALAGALPRLPPRVLSLWATDPAGADQAFSAAYCLAQMVQESDPAPGLRLVFAATGSARIGDEAGGLPGTATLLGLVRVAPREISGLSAALVDIGTLDAAMAAPLLAEAAAATGDDQIALRGSRRLVRRRLPGPVPATAALPRRLREGGHYVLTGGMGGIGRLLAEWLATTARARLTLVSRHAAENQALRARIEAAGGEVAFETADVTDETGMAAVLDRARKRFGTIHGVIHAAGVLNDAPLALQPLDEALAVMAPKLSGAAILDRLLPAGTLDVFAVFSSSSVVIGGAGQAGYAAANAAAEAIAAGRPDGLSIAWGAWRDVGMAARSYGAGEAAAGDALIGTRHDGPGGVVTFDLRIDPADDWRVGDHVVAGTPVLPGTAYLELADAALCAVSGGRSLDIVDLSFERPMTFAGRARQVSLRLDPQPDGWALSVSSRPGPGHERIEHLHARAVVRAGGQMPSVAAAVAGDRLVDRPRGVHPPANGPIAFGPRWQVVDSLRTAPGRAEGLFRLPEPFHGDLARHPLHPGLLDMAATVGLAALDPAPGQIHVPMSIGRMRVVGDLTPEVVARATQVSGQAGGFAAFDVVILDPTGRPLIEIGNFALRVIDASALGQAETAPPSLTDLLLDTGIRAGEAPGLFARVFDHPEHALVVSPVSLDAVRMTIDSELTLPDRPAVAAASGPAFADPLMAKVAAIWSDILGVQGIGAEDGFADLGGHSLNAVRMFGRLRRDLGVTLPMTAIFEAPRLGDFVALLRSHGVDLAPEPASAPALAIPAIDTPARSLPAPAAGSAPEAATAVSLRLPMTEGQREIAAAIVVDPSASLSYNLSFSFHLDGGLRLPALREALAALVRRHEALRATFDPGAAEIIIHPQAEAPLEAFDLSGLTEAEAATRRESILRAAGAEPFDLEHGPVLRALALALPAGRSELVCFVHHIACDGWSFGQIAPDIARLYSAAVAGQPADLPAVPGIRNLIEAEAALVGTAAAQADRDFWLGTYAGALPAMDLPTDRPHPMQRQTEADRVETRLAPDLETVLRRRAREAGVPLRNLVFAAFRVYLARLLGDGDVVVALPASGQLAHGLDGAVAHGISLLPIRATIDAEKSLGTLVAEARGDLMAALDHQSYSYGSLIRDLHLPRDPSRLALVPVVFNFDNLADLGPLDFAGDRARIEVNATGHEHFEIFFNIFDAPGRVEMTWNYQTALFDPRTISIHAENFLRMLTAIAEDGAALDRPAAGFILGDPAVPASGSMIDPGANGPQTITEVFRAIAGALGDRPALRFGDEVMDYRDLDRRSDALAGQLSARGIGPGDLVGIASQRSLSLIVAVLGVLKAGAGYVPFDLALPEDRLQFMAGDTGIRLLIGTCPAVEALGIATLPWSDMPRPGTPQSGPAPEVAVGADSIAYVMFTSGTTGVPKGVVLPHRSVIRMLCDTDWLRLSAQTVTLHSSAFAFDTSIIDIFAALLHGGTVVIPPDGALSISQLSSAISSHGVNTLWLTTGLFHAVADLDPGVFARVDQLVVGGDVVSPSHVARVKAACPQLHVINGYGPTESNVTNAHEVTTTDLARGMPLPIGRAVPGTQIWIVDEAMRPLPPGLRGELCIGGRGLALGYWNRPDLTASKFVAAPWDPSLLLYRSGDLATDPGDGILRFFGRADTQVKVRGFRVELTEVETAVAAHPGVRQVVVTAQVPEGQSDKVLVAHVVAQGAAPEPADLAAHCAERLPEFARPAFFVLHEALPLNANGKIDRRALPAVRFEADAEGFQPPATDTEIRLAAIWSAILGGGQIGRRSNFFSLGGHSLLAVRLFDQIRRDFGHDLPISTLFRHQTLADLAARLDHEGPVAATDVADAPWDTSTVIDIGPKTGGGRPLFIVGGVGGNVNNLLDLGLLIGRDRPVIGFQTRGVQGHRPHDSIETMASENIRYLRAHQATGPYLIAGYSGGAFTALEMARQLEAAGETVERLFVLDTYAPGFASDFRPMVRMSALQKIGAEIDLLRDEGLGYLAGRIRGKLRTIFYRGPLLKLVRRVSLSHYRYQVMQDVWMDAARRYLGGPIAAPVTLVRVDPVRLAQKLALEQDPSLGWAALTQPGHFEAPAVPGNHLSMLHGPNARVVAEVIEARIRRRPRPDQRAG